jgi:hypothetical protein
MIHPSTVYLGVGVGFDGHRHPYYRAAIRAMHGLGFQPARVVTTLPLSSELPTEKEIEARMTSCSAVMVPLCLLPLSRKRHLSVGHTPSEELKQAVELIEREYQVVSRLRAEVEADDPTVTEFRAPTGRRHFILIPTGKAGLRADTPWDLLGRAKALCQRAESCHGTANTFRDTKELWIRVSSLLLRGLPGQARVQVMLSSTVRDFSDERPILERTFQYLGHTPGSRFELLNFEHQLTDRTPEASSIRLVRKATVYLGMIKSRHGNMPTVDGLSLTEQEYEEAKRRGMPRYFLFGKATRYAGPETYDQGDGEADKVERFKDKVRSDRTPYKDYNLPGEIPEKVIELLDWLTRPGVDQYTLPPPPTGNVYVAHPYILLEEGDEIVRKGFHSRLDDWYDHQSAPPCLVVEALGGMGKSAVAWNWFQQVTTRERLRPQGLWWSFYAADAGIHQFACQALSWLDSRVGTCGTALPDKPTERQLLEAVLARLRALNCRFLLVFDGVERILTFYRSYREVSRDRDGPAVANRLRELADELARKPQSGFDNPAMAQDYLLSFDDPEANAPSSYGDRRVVDHSAFAWFLRELAADGKDRVLMTTRFTPTVVESMVTNNPQPLARRELLPGLTEAEVEELWVDKFHLAWETTPLPRELGGGSLPDLCTKTLQGYALPIVLLTQLVRNDKDAGGSFRKWKGSLPPPECQARWAELDDVPVDVKGIDNSRQRMIALVGKIVLLTLAKFDPSGPHAQVLAAILHRSSAVSAATLRNELIQNRKVIRSDQELKDALETLRRVKLIGRDEHLYMYEMHPLLREAYRDFPQKLAEAPHGEPSGEENWRDRPPASVTAEEGITNTTGWAEERIARLLAEVKARVGWDGTTGLARMWWEAFEGRSGPRRTLHLAEELMVRKATVSDYYHLAYAYTGSDTTQVNLAYLDYSRRRKQAERWKKAAAVAARFADPPQGSPVPRPSLGVADRLGWTDDQFRARLTEVERGMGCASARQNVRRWWEEVATTQQPKELLPLAEELMARKATVTEFYDAALTSNTDDLWAVLLFLDYARLKQADEQRMKDAATTSLKSDLPNPSRR